MKRKVAIAIVDSGISKQFINKVNCSTEVYQVEEDNNLYSIKEGGYDETGHGTLCASTIYKECNDINLISIKIFDNKLESKIEYLERALEFLLHKDVQLINLSVSLTRNSYSRKIHNICNKLHRQGKIMISSVENGKKKSKPACYRSVIGVRGIRMKDELWFNSVKKVNCIVNSIPYMHIGMSGYYQMFGDCNSYAAAKVTGIFSRIILELHTTDKRFIINEFKKLSSKKNWNERTIIDNRCSPIFKDETKMYEGEKLKDLVSVLASFFDVDEDLLYKYSLYSTKISKKAPFYFELLKCLEEKYDFLIEDYYRISKMNFVSIYTIYDLIREELGK